MIRITGFNSFGKKRFEKFFDGEKRFSVYNVFGFGVWIIKDKELKQYAKKNWKSLAKTNGWR